MKKILMTLALGAALSATLSGCGSSVPLNDVPVEDKTGNSVNVASRDVANDPNKLPGGNSLGESNVKQLDLGKTPQDGVGPNTARIIYFDFDSFEIKPEYQAVIEAHARYVKLDPKRHVTVEGNTDERGGREYNLALGQKRAEAVRKALGLLGVADSQVEAVSFGKEKLAAQGGDEASMAQNRRAEIVYR